MATPLRAQRNWRTKKLERCGRLLRGYQPFSRPMPLSKGITVRLFLHRRAPNMVNSLFTEVGEAEPTSVPSPPTN
jgi:hypothetical protein